MGSFKGVCKDVPESQKILLQLLNGQTVIVYGGSNANYLNDTKILALLAPEPLSRLHFNTGIVPVSSAAGIPEEIMNSDDVSAWIF